MKKKVESVELFFCDFDVNNRYKLNRAMKHFEKARFQVAEDLRIHEFFQGKRVQFLITKLKSEVLSPVDEASKSVQIETQIETPDVGKLVFKQAIVQNGEVRLKADFDIAVFVEGSGVQYNFDERLIERVREYNEG